MIIHGLKDTLINVEQALKLYEVSKQSLRKIHLSKEMTHNQFNFKEDILGPIRHFKERIDQLKMLKEN